MGRLAVSVCAAMASVGLLVPAPTSAATSDCPNLTVIQRLAAADVSFVGSIVESRPAGDERLTTFQVDKAVKGELTDQVVVVSGPLVDAGGNAIDGDIDVGVFATLEGGTYRTDSCGLVDPSLLLEAADEPRGGAVKLLVGFVILAAVLGFALLRLRRRGQR
jgi:hypothetical protein